MLKASTYFPKNIVAKIHDCWWHDKKISATMYAFCCERPCHHRRIPAPKELYHMEVLKIVCVRKDKVRIFQYRN